MPLLEEKSFEYSQSRVILGKGKVFEGWLMNEGSRSEWEIEWIDM